MAAAFGAAARQYGQAKRNIVEHGHMAEQRVMLEYKAHLAIAGMQTAHVGAVKADVPAGLMLKPGDNAQSVVLPEPDGPSSATICPEGISSEISFSTWVRPKDFLILAISMLMISLLMLTFFLIF
jgi:hypothetical protein